MIAHLDLDGLTQPDVYRDGIIGRSVHDGVRHQLAGDQLEIVDHSGRNAAPGQELGDSAANGGDIIDAVRLERQCQIGAR